MQCSSIHITKTITHVFELRNIVDYIPYRYRQEGKHCKCDKKKSLYRKRGRKTPEIKNELDAEHYPPLQLLVRVDAIPYIHHVYFNTIANPIPSAFCATPSLPYGYEPLQQLAKYAPSPLSPFGKYPRENEVPLYA
jgi:hypothetical protein